MILGNDFSQSVFNTGKLFIGTHELPFLLGIPAMTVFLYLLCSFVGIGEESFFRGFLYEELGATFNDWVGKATDMILFHLFHVSSEIKFYQDNPQYFW